MNGQLFVFQAILPQPRMTKTVSFNPETCKWKIANRFQRKGVNLGLSKRRLYVHSFDALTLPRIGAKIEMYPELSMRTARTDLTVSAMKTSKSILPEIEREKTLRKVQA